MKYFFFFFFFFPLKFAMGWLKAAFNLSEFVGA